jgi:hypothetical protein
MVMERVFTNTHNTPAGGATRAQAPPPSWTAAVSQQHPPRPTPHHTSRTRGSPRCESCGLRGRGQYSTVTHTFLGVFSLSESESVCSHSSSSPFFLFRFAFLPVLVNAVISAVCSLIPSAAARGTREPTSVQTLVFDIPLRGFGSARAECSICYHRSEPSSVRRSSHAHTGWPVHSAASVGLRDAQAAPLVFEGVRTTRCTYV